MSAIVAPATHARPLQKGFWGPAEIDGVSQFPLYRQTMNPSPEPVNWQ